MPANADGFDLLVVLGGPQSPATTLADRRFVQPPPVLCANRYEPMNQALFGFLDHLVADCQAAVHRLA